MARASEEGAFHGAGRACREVICSKGQATERTREWVFFIYKSVLVLFLFLFPHPKR